jgi:sugar-specific transcriptional regulator TrmB
MDLSVFEEIGLSNAETKIYLALLKLGSATAGPILEETSLHNSVTHSALHRLVEKGFVSFVKKGKVKHYQATDPHTVLDFFDEKKKRFEAVLPELIAKQVKLEKQDAEIFEGFRGFKSMLFDVIKDGKKGDEYLFFSFFTENPDDFGNVYNFYKEFEIERKRRGIIVKGIAPAAIKEKFKGRDTRNILFTDLPVLTNIFVFKDRVGMTPWQDKKICFLIHSKQLATEFRNYFYSIWNRKETKRI